MNTATFERELSEAFEGGAVRRRELRLDRNEAAHLRERGAQVTELASSEDIASSGGKFWYEIAFRRADMNEAIEHS